MIPPAPFGAVVVPGGVRFRVWCPAAGRVEVEVEGHEGGVGDLAPHGEGIFCGRVEGIGAGARYRFRLDGEAAYPDPASRFQPEGIGGPSEVVDPAGFRWQTEGWHGRPREELVIYELHTGTFTPQGTFGSATGKLGELADLGVTAIELMPVAEFAGARNWGYDGVFPYAPSRAYGTPDDLRRLVDTAHAYGLAVLLDVVYNHLGPEGNVLPALTGGAFFTDRHRTPWGDAIDYARRPVRDFLIGNALHWLDEYRIDGLRLDATHAIVDDGEPHFLAELADRVRTGVGGDRQVVLVAEDDRNERRLLEPRQDGGYGMDAVWADDFHHVCRVRGAGDRDGYFADFEGTTVELSRVLARGWVYEGQPSAYRGGPRGTPADGLPPAAFVHALQNHDQVGNRAFGERLHHQIDPAVYRALCTLLLLSPHTPLLFMGQEWAATTPFLYFTDHAPGLGKLVTEGRRAEFGRFASFADPEAREKIPDPQDPDTFRRSVLRWDEREGPGHVELVRLHGALLEVRRTLPPVGGDRRGLRAEAVGEGAVSLARPTREGTLGIVASTAGELMAPLAGLLPDGAGEGRWSLVLATEEARFGGEGGWGRLEADGTIQLLGPGAVVVRAQG